VEQLGAIVAALTKRDLNREPHLSNLRERYEVSRFDELTKEQASAIIDGVNNRGLDQLLVDKAHEHARAQRESIEAERRRIEQAERQQELDDQVRLYGRELSREERDLKRKANTAALKLILSPTDQDTYQAAYAQALDAPTDAERLSQHLNLWREYALERNTSSATQVSVKL
jgi:hypothetical protein